MAKPRSSASKTEKRRSLLTRRSLSTSFLSNLTITRPAEAKEYNFFVNVKSSDIIKELETKRIHLKGWGYDTEKPVESILPPSQMPKFKCSSDELSPQAFFSIEELDYGELSAKEMVSRVVILYNNSSTSRLKFEFEKVRFIW